MGLSEFLESEETALVKAEEGQLIIAKQIQQQLIDFENTRKDIEKKEKDLKEKLYLVMKENNITGYESGDKRIKITLGEDSITETIDKERLWLEHPDIYKQYVKETPRKGILRITIRKEDE